MGVGTAREYHGLCLCRRAWDYRGRGGGGWPACGADHTGKALADGPQRRWKAHGQHQTVGGKIPGKLAFATVRTVKKDGSDVIFSVGKGAVSELKAIERLAQKYGAEICCSRIVADSGKLPYEKQVGLTGRTVCPKVYVAFGISGAVQHTCAIAGAGTVIAVNIDKQARIFDYADYGIIDDVKNITIGE